MSINYKNRQFLGKLIIQRFKNCVFLQFSSLNCQTWLNAQRLVCCLKTLWFILELTQRKMTAADKLDYSCPCNLKDKSCDLNCCCDKVRFTFLYLLGPRCWTFFKELKNSVRNLIFSLLMSHWIFFTGDQNDLPSFVDQSLFFILR